MTDIISNHSFEGSIQCHDLFLNANDTSLKPELIISFGNSVISKNLKTFLRTQKPIAHWHIQEAGSVADTFQSLTRHVQVSPARFFAALSTLKTNAAAYLKTWQELDRQYRPLVQNFLTEEKQFSEFEVVWKVLNQVPENSMLHLANSMPVRYANYIGVKNKNIEVIANRGTSGIDGVISTAYGTALATDKLVTVLTGDMSFLYDRNAFWNNHLPSNLRIIILNNHGGGIFRMIEGPASQPEGEEYFVTKQVLTAENTLKDFDLDYRFIQTRSDFESEMKNFFESSGKSKVLEVETNGMINTEVWKKFKKSLTN